VIGSGILKKIYIFIVIILIFSSIFFIKFNPFSDNQLKEVSYDVDESLQEITMLRAYEIGIEKAKTYDDEPELVYLNSVDDKKVSGGDGKKGNWQGIISLPNKNQRFIFAIEKGELKNFKFMDGSEKLTIKDSDIKVDSDQIVMQAVTEFKLEPGNNQFSNGYHFRILRDEKNIFMAVNGQVDKKEMEIYYNPKDGKYMGNTEDAID